MGFIAIGIDVAEYWTNYQLKWHTWWLSPIYANFFSLQAKKIKDMLIFIRGLVII